MRRATRLVSACLGGVAGLAGMEHGVFEILQGNVEPAGVMIASNGPPCVAERAWNACEPAMTIVPSFSITGILSVILGLLVLLWSLAFVQRRSGGAVLIALSIVLLLFGGGFFPPMIGIVAALAARNINKPLPGAPAAPTARLAGRLWPWPLVVLLVWLFGQFLVGHFFNEILKSIMGPSVLLILALLPVSVYTAYAHDRLSAQE